MIQIKNSDIQKIAKAFFDRIKADMIAEVHTNKSFLQGYYTKSGKTLFDFLADQTNLELIITSDLKNLTTTIQPELQNLFSTEYIKDSNFQKISDKIFFYSSHDKWQAYQLFTEIGLTVCPYCNRNYITALGTDDEKFVRGDYDHFLIKSAYPYFQLSFFNLIPSCFICNQRAKRATETDLLNHIYPHTEAFDTDAVFSYLPKTSTSEEKPFLLVRDLNSDKGKRIKGNIDVFRLDQQYSTHSLELKHLLHLKKKNATVYTRWLNTIIPLPIARKRDRYELLIGKPFDEKDFHTQPLSKFTKDIANELGLV